MELVHHLLHEAEFWVALGFIIFVVLVWKKAKVAILGALDARAAKIAEQLAEAAQLRSEAAAMLKDAEARHAKAANDVEAIVKAARDEADLIRRQSAVSLEDLLKRRKQAALDKIAQAEAAAIDEVRRAAVDLAIAATKRLLESHLQGAAADAMIDGAIEELPLKLSA